MMSVVTNLRAHEALFLRSWVLGKDIVPTIIEKDKKESDNYGKKKKLTDLK